MGLSLSLEQVAAQLGFLESQRRQIEEAITALREAQRRLLEQSPAATVAANRVTEKPSDAKMEGRSENPNGRPDFQ
jgi:hypothetical protein